MFSILQHKQIPFQNLERGGKVKLGSKDVSLHFEEEGKVLEMLLIQWEKLWTKVVTQCDKTLSLLVWDVPLPLLIPFYFSPGSSGYSKMRRVVAAFLALLALANGSSCSAGMTICPAGCCPFLDAYCCENNWQCGQTPDGSDCCTGSISDSPDCPVI